MCYYTFLGNHNDLTGSAPLKLSEPPKVSIFHLTRESEHIEYSIVQEPPGSQLATSYVSRIYVITFNSNSICSSYM